MVNVYGLKILRSHARQHAIKTLVRDSDFAMSEPPSPVDGSYGQQKRPEDDVDVVRRGEKLSNVIVVVRC